MGHPAERLPTFAELYLAVQALPPGLTGEILGPGVMRAMGRPGRRHRFAARRVERSLAPHDLMEGGSGWWIEVEAELQLGDRLYVPDLAGWKVEEEPAFVDDNPIGVPPDWVCEIPSRSTQRADRAEKLPVYAACGVGHAWIVDPDARTVEVYALQRGRYVLVGTALGATAQELPPFPNPIDLGSWWAADRPTSAPAR